MINENNIEQVKKVEHDSIDNKSTGSNEQFEKMQNASICFDEVLAGQKCKVKSNAGTIDLSKYPQIKMIFDNPNPFNINEKVN